METNTKITCYSNYDRINDLKKIGLKNLDLSLWLKNKNGYYFYFLIFRYNEQYPDEKLISLARSLKNFYIVLDDTEEAYAYHSFSKVHEFVQSNQLENKVIYATGHLEVDKIYTHWLKEKNYSSIFKVWSFNLWYHRMHDWILDCEIPVNFQKNKWYCCMNNRPRLHRLFTIAYLDSLDILDDGVVSANDRNYETNDGDSFEIAVSGRIPNIGIEYQKIIQNQIKLTSKKLPLIVDTNDLQNKCLPNDLHPKIYDNTLINLVTETMYYPEYNEIDESFITEKTWKVFTAGQIPVIIGPKFIVKRLRDYGFDMFDDIVDHSYDNLDDSERLFKAIESMQRVMATNNISSLNLKTLKRRMYNRKHFLYGVKIGTSIMEAVCK